MHFHYRVTLTGYIRCFCATTSHDLVTLTFDLLTLIVFRVQCFSCLTHLPILIIGYWVYDYWISDHISVIWNSHCACVVSLDLYQGAKIVYILKSLIPIFLIVARSFPCLITWSSL